MPNKLEPPPFKLGSEVEPNLNTFRGRFKFAIGDKSSSLFARETGISASSIRGYRDEDGSDPSIEMVIKLAKGLRVDPAWLAFGVNPEPMQEPKAQYNVAPDFILVKSEEGAAMLAIPPTWCKTGRSESCNIKAFRVTEDSMEPTVPRGSLLIYCPQGSGSGCPHSDGLYVIRISGGLACRRLQRLPGDSTAVVCDNGIYKEWVVQANDLDIAGRVVWLLRDVM